MLEVFRENLRSLSWVLYLVIISFILFFGVDWYDSCRRGRATGDWATVVGERSVSRSVLSWQAERIRRGLPVSRESADLSLQLLVDRLLAVSDAERLGMRVTNDELDAAIRNDPFYTDPETGTFVGRDVYLQAIRRGSAGSPYRSVEAHESWVRDDRLLQRWAQLIRNASPSDPDFVREYLRRQTARAAARYVTVAPGDVPSAGAPGDDEVGRFAVEQADRFLRRGLVVVFDETAVAPEELVVSDAEISEYVRLNPELYATPSRREARVILLEVPAPDAEATTLEEARELAEQLRLGEADFAEAARARSDHGPSRESGGTLGLLGREELAAVDSQLAAVAFGGVDSGEVLGPVRGAAGYWILRVDRMEGGYVPEVLPEEQENQVRVLLRARLLDEATRAAAIAFRREVSDAAGMADLAEASGLTPVETGPVAAGQAPEGIRAGALVTDRLFDLEEDEVGRVIALGQAYAIVGRLPLGEAPEPTPETLEAARTALVSERGERALTALVDEVRAAGGDLGSLASRLSLSPQETPGAVGYDLLGTLLGPEGRTVALTGLPGQLQGPFPAGRLLVLFEVTELPPAELPAESELQALEQRVQDSLARMLAGALLGDLQDRSLREGQLRVRPELGLSLTSSFPEAPRFLTPFTIPSSN